MPIPQHALRRLCLARRILKGCAPCRRPPTYGSLPCGWHLLAGCLLGSFSMLAGLTIPCVALLKGGGHPAPSHVSKPRLSRL